MRKLSLIAVILCLTSTVWGQWEAFDWFKGSKQGTGVTITLPPALTNTFPDTSGTIWQVAYPTFNGVGQYAQTATACPTFSLWGYDSGYVQIEFKNTLPLQSSDYNLIVGQGNFAGMNLYTWSGDGSIYLVYNYGSEVDLLVGVVNDSLWHIPKYWYYNTDSSWHCYIDNINTHNYTKQRKMIPTGRIYLGGFPTGNNCKVSVKDLIIHAYKNGIDSAFTWLMDEGVGNTAYLLQDNQKYDRGGNGGRQIVSGGVQDISGAFIDSTSWSWTNETPKRYKSYFGGFGGNYFGISEMAQNNGIYIKDYLGAFGLGLCKIYDNVNHKFLISWQGKGTTINVHDIGSVGSYANLTDNINHICFVDSLGVFTSAGYGAGYFIGNFTVCSSSLKDTILCVGGSFDDTLNGVWNLSAQYTTNLGTDWNALGNPNGGVYAMKEDIYTHKLIMGGGFTACGGFNTSNIIECSITNSGVTFDTLSTGCTNTVWSIEVDANNIYTGCDIGVMGTYNKTTKHWSYSTITGSTATIGKLILYNGIFYAGVYTPSPYYLYKYVNGIWTGLLQMTTQEAVGITSMSNANGIFYICGNFVNVIGNKNQVYSPNFVAYVPSTDIVYRMTMTVAARPEESLWMDTWQKNVYAGDFGWVDSTRMATIGYINPYKTFTDNPSISHISMKDSINQNQTPTYAYDTCYNLYGSDSVVFFKSNYNPNNFVRLGLGTLTNWNVYKVTVFNDTSGLKFDSSYYVNVKLYIGGIVLTSTNKRVIYKAGISVSLVPALTSNVSAFPFVISASSFTATFDPYKAFNLDSTTNTDEWLSSGNVPQWLIISLNKSYELTGYSIASGSYNPASPKSWVVTSSIDSSTWIGVDTQTNVSAWTDPEVRRYTLAQTIICKYIKINFTANFAGGANILSKAIKLYGY